MSRHPVDLHDGPDIPHLYGRFLGLKLDLCTISVPLGHVLESR